MRFSEHLLVDRTKIIPPYMALSAMSTVLARVRSLRRSGLVSLGRSSSFLFGTRIIGAAAAYFTQVLLARWAGPVELGIYVLAFSWCIVISNLAVMGFPTVAVRTIAAGLASGNRGEARGFVRRSRQLVVGGGVLLAALAALAVLSWSSEITDDRRVPFFIALACVPLFSLMRIQGGIAHAFSWFRHRELPNQVLRPLFLLASIWLAWRCGYALSAALVLSLHFAIILLLDIGQGFFLSRRLRVEFGAIVPNYRTGMWVKSALPLLLVAQFTLYFPELNIILVGSLLPETDIAVYNACFRTAFIIAFGLMAVDSVILPRIVYLYEKGEAQELQRLVTRSTLLKFLGALLALLVLGIAGKQILSLFGPNFVVGFTTLLLLGLALMIRAIGGIAAELLAVTGHHNRSFPVFGCALAATVVLNGLLIPAFGLTGAATSVVLVTAFSTLWLNLLVFRHLGISPSILGNRRSGPRCSQSV